MIVHECTVRTGGPLTNLATIPSHVNKTFLYHNRIVLDMDASQSSNEFEQIFESRGFPGLKSFEGEWEIVIRGKMGNKSTDFQLLYGDAVMLTIYSIYFPSSTDGDLNIVNDFMDVYNDRPMDDYFEKYIFNPFHRNADFDLLIHRMSGEKTDKIQVTVHSNSRIASYYVEADTKVTSSIKLKITPEDKVEVYQAVLMV